MNYDNFFTYDDLGRLRQMRAGSAGGTLLAEYDYADEPGGGDSRIGNITMMNEGSGPVSRGYDGAVAPVHAPRTVGGIYYDYDLNGNLSARRSNGVDYLERYTFDADNQLVWNKDQQYPNFENAHLYDGQGNRVRLQTHSTQPGFSTRNLDYYIGGIYKARASSSGTTCNAPHQQTSYYMAFGRAIAQRFATATSSSPTYLLADHLNSTVGSISTGLIGTYRYWPFGTFRGTGSLPTDRGYTGQIKEGLGTTIGAYYYNARFYSTTLGTFMSADTLTVDGLNRYAYVRGNPLRYNDPSGHAAPGIDPGKPNHPCTPDNAYDSTDVCNVNRHAPVADPCAPGDWACGVKHICDANPFAPGCGHVPQAPTPPPPAPEPPSTRTSENGGGCGWNPACQVQRGVHNISQEARAVGDRIRVVVTDADCWGLALDGIGLAADAVGAATLSSGAIATPPGAVVYAASFGVGRGAFIGAFTIDAATGDTTGIYLGLTSAVAGPVPVAGTAADLVAASYSFKQCAQ